MLTDEIEHRLGVHSMLDTRSKDRERAEIQRLTDAYLAEGNAIENMQIDAYERDHKVFFNNQGALNAAKKTKK